LRTSSKGGNVPADVVQKYYLINGLSKYYQGDLGEAHGFLAKSISVLPNCAACYYALSNVLVKAGFMNDALNASRMAFSLDSTNFWYGKHLAQVSDFNGNVELATKTYKYLLSNFKNIKDEDIVFSLGSLYCRQNQFDEALYLYDSLQKVSGLDERIVFLKQQIYFATNNNSAALVEALRYFERNTEDPHANVLLAEVFGRSGKDSIALQYLERAHKLDQDYAAPLFNLAELYRKNYEYDKFFNILDEIAVNMNIPLSDKVEYFSFAVQFWSQIRYRDKVENLFPLLAKNNSGAWAFKQFYAAFLMQTERQKQAMEIVNEELQQNIKNVDAWNLKISMLYYAHDLENTLSALDSAVLYSRNKYTLLMQKSSVLYEMKRYKEAISILENLLKSKENEKNKKEILSILGDLYHAAGNKKEAYKVYQKVLDFDTINVGILNNYAYYLSEDNKDLKKALVMSKKTIDAQPENATFLDTYAWILHKLGRDEEAKPVFRRAMTFGGRESAVILDHYGDVLFALKEYDVAILYWEDALSKKDVANPEKIKMKIEKSKQIQNKK
jgi:pentatricopeptide repeat protein